VKADGIKSRRLQADFGEVEPRIFIFPPRPGLGSPRVPMLPIGRREKSVRPMALRKIVTRSRGRVAGTEGQVCERLTDGVG
jgi:hypothetical protein